MAEKKNKKILIVEDEPKIVEAYSDFLDRLGYKVTVAYNGAEGLRQARALVPDLILLDIMMPVMDGFAMLKEMKKNPELNKIPVIVLSNLDSADTVGKAVENGVMNYLVKANYSLEALKEKIELVLFKK